MQHCSSFWASEELRAAVQGGQLLAMEPAFWAAELHALLTSREHYTMSDRAGSPARGRSADSARSHGSGQRRSRSRSLSGSPDRRRRRRSTSRDSRGDSPEYEVQQQDRWRERVPDDLGTTGTGWQAGEAQRLRYELADFLECSPWTVLCTRLLHVLPDPALLRFATELLADAECAEPAALLVCGRARWHTLDDLMLACALGLHSQQVWRLIAEDDDDLQVRTCEHMAIQLISATVCTLCAGKPHL